MNKISTTSENMESDNLEKLRAVFPQFVKDGNIDFDALKAFFEKEGKLPQNQEKYGLSWAGKSNAFKLIKTPATGTLTPNEKESVDFDKTENLFIEGDNLEVLKLLQKHYREKIKMIYIDPPYNTGKDFIYKDNFKENISDYYERTGQSENGIKLTTNPESAGRYHSDWLTMMYPRLFLARNLLKEDGVIFISIDDFEMANLRLIMNEIFGEENSLTESPTALIWQRSGSTAGHFANAHEYILCYAKNKEGLPFFKLSDYGEDSVIAHGALKRISSANPASEITFPVGFEYDGKDAVFEEEIGGSEKEFISGKMIFKDGKLAEPVIVKAGWGMRDQVLSWIDGEETYDTKGQKIIRFYFNKEGILWYEKERGTVHPKTILDKEVGTTKTGSTELQELMKFKAIDYPKPSSLLKFFYSFSTSENDIVLDFFAGSGTTAHAVMNLNAEDGGNRKWICVQLPEETDEDSEARKVGFQNIAQISRERIRRAANVIASKAKQSKLSFEQGENSGPDLGFKALTLSKSNYRQWNELTDQDDPKKLLEQQKLFLEKPLVDGFDEKAVVYEILLKEGYDLNSEVKKENDFWIIDDCHPELGSGSRKITISFADKLSKKEIEKLDLAEGDTFVCLDSSLDDSAKVNILRRWYNVKTL